MADPEEWQQAIEQHEQNSDGGDHGDGFAVWPENWKTLRIFLSIARRLNPDGLSGQYLAVPRADIESALTMFNVRRTKKLAMLENLLAMESAALEVLNRK